MKTTRWAVLALAPLLLGGCFQSFTQIRLAKDGSGTVEERFLLANRFADMLRSVSVPEPENPAGEAVPGDSIKPGQAQAPEAPADPQAVDLPRLRARAAEMGLGVELEKAEALRTAAGAGYLAVFRFTDINLLELRFDPGRSLAEANGEQSGSPEPIRFRFTPGGSMAWLDILLPSTEQDGQTAKPAGSGAADEATLHMLRQVYGDMKIRLALEVDGTITASNASYREGSTVTLLDLDFGLLLQDDEAFRRIAAARPRHLADLNRLAAGNPALKIESQETVRVRFR
jgi:hypothetical protein